MSSTTTLLTRVRDVTGSPTQTRSKVSFPSGRRKPLLPSATRPQEAPHQTLEAPHQTLRRHANASLKRSSRRASRLDECLITCRIGMNSKFN
eukprot:278265-Pyramimonas_sp.AAC.1